MSSLPCLSSASQPLTLNLFAATQPRSKDHQCRLRSCVPQADSHPAPSPAGFPIIYKITLQSPSCTDLAPWEGLFSIKPQESHYFSLSPKAAEGKAKVGRAEEGPSLEPGFKVKAVSVP